MTVQESSLAAQNILLAPVADNIKRLWMTLPSRYNAASHFVDRHLGEGRGAKVAFIDDRGKYTYEELAARVNRAGNVLRQLGVEMEQRVLLCLLDTIDFPSLFWGAIKIGAVAVPANTMLTTDDYQALLEDSRARVLAVSAPLYERFKPIIDKQKLLSAVLICGESAEAASEKRIYSFDTLCRQASAQLEPVDTSPDDVAFWLYSSGSTGAPKGAVHLHGDLVQTAVLYGQNILGIREDDLVFSAPKLFFAYGLGNSMTFPLQVGATAVLTAARPTPAIVIELMRKYRPTIFYGVPTLYAAILAAADVDFSGAFERLRWCVSAGEALPEEIGLKWKERFGVDILDGIGTTEILHIFISNRPGDVRYGTSGKPVPGYEVRILDGTGREVADKEIGDLWVRGPSISPYYWNKREQSAQTMYGRWIRTGDKYWRDEQGYFHYAGRSDDMLKVGGIWVSPFEVESALAAHPAVLEAAVVGASDADGLTKPKAFVVLKEGFRASAELEAELKAFVKSRLAPYKYPRWVEFRTELPKTATGKIQRFKLRES